MTKFSTAGGDFFHSGLLISFYLWSLLCLPLLFNSISSLSVINILSFGIEKWSVKYSRWQRSLTEPKNATSSIYGSVSLIHDRAHSSKLKFLDFDFYCLRALSG